MNDLVDVVAVMGVFIDVYIFEKVF